MVQLIVNIIPERAKACSTSLFQDALKIWLHSLFLEGRAFLKGSTNMMHHAGIVCVASIGDLSK